MPPLISIITPTLNAGNDLLKTLESVARQTYVNYEHLIMDGLSTDGTAALVNEQMKQNPRIRFFSEKDTGIYHAMNKGLVQCTGDWIYFLGAGDKFYHENILMELFCEGFFEKEHVIYGNVKIIGDAGWANEDRPYDGPFDLVKLLYRNICHQSIFYPQSVIQRIGHYNAKYYITADWDYNLHCWSEYPFLYVDKIIACFIAGGASTSAGDQEFADDRAANIIRYFKLNPWSPEFDKPGSPFYYFVLQYRQRSVLG